MGISVQADVSPRIYEGESTIYFDSKESGLDVTIETKRLCIESTRASEEIYDRYAALFGDKDVMEKYATGETKTKEEISSRIKNVWDRRWTEGDPYAAFAVYLKGTNIFIGHVILGHGDAPGEAEIAFLFHKAHWRQGYGTEAAKALVNEYAPATVKEGYLLEGKPLEKIVATARPDNPASGRILEKVGMQIERSEEKYGAQRNYYSICLKQLQQKV